MPSGNQAQAPQLLSLCSKPQELQLLSPWATSAKVRVLQNWAPQQEKPLQQEARTLQLEKNPQLPQGGKSLAPSPTKNK